MHSDHRSPSEDQQEYGGNKPEILLFALIRPDSAARKMGLAESQNQE
jgi:hypothetical protein